MCFLNTTNSCEERRGEARRNKVKLSSILHLIVALLTLKLAQTFLFLCYPLGCALNLTTTKLFCLYFQLDSTQLDFTQFGQVFQAKKGSVLFRCTSCFFAIIRFHASGFAFMEAVVSLVAHSAPVVWFYVHLLLLHKEASERYTHRLIPCYAEY